MARVKALIANDPLRRWTASDALDLYNIPRWGCGYFKVNDKGKVTLTYRPVHTEPMLKPEDGGIDPAKIAPKKRVY